MQTVRLEYGDSFVDARLPAAARVLEAGRSQPEPPPLADPETATRDAVRQPLGTAPLVEQVRPGSTVTIAFPDRVKGGMHDTAHRRVAMRVLLDELERAGVRSGDIRLVCAIGLHRKNHLAELESMLGPETLHRVAAAHVVNHDAEDPDQIVDLGPSRHGDPVQCHRLLVESDLTILIGHASGNPYGGFSGGYKMPATGLTTWRSIRSHHSPGTMGRPDFVPATTGSHFREQLRAIGQQMEAVMPAPFFAVDAVLDSRSRQISVAAGAIPAVEAATWPAAHRRTDLAVDEAADVLIIGLPRRFHYGDGMGSNPVLVMQAVGAALTRSAAALRPDPVVIAASVCDGYVNEAEFPATVAVYDALQTVPSAMELTRFEEEFSTREDWVARYRHGFAYHPFHAFSMAYMGGLARLRTSAVYLAGAVRPDLARGVGAVPTATVEDALADAASLVGGDPRVLVIPRLSEPAYHLSTAGAGN